MTLRTRLMVFVLMVLYALSVVFCTVAYWKMISALEQEIQNEIKMAADNKVSFVSEWVDSRQKIVGSVLPRFGTGDLKPMLDQARDAGGEDRPGGDGAEGEGDGSSAGHELFLSSDCVVIRQWRTDVGGALVQRSGQVSDPGSLARGQMGP